MHAGYHASQAVLGQYDSVYAYLHMTSELMIAIDAVLARSLQQCGVMQACGFSARSYQGNGTFPISSLTKEAWTTEWQALDVLVMTPDMLLRFLAQGFMSVSSASDPASFHFCGTY